MVVGKQLEVALLWPRVEWRVVEDVPGTVSFSEPSRKAVLSVEAE